MYLLSVRCMLSIIAITQPGEGGFYLFCRKFKTLNEDGLMFSDKIALCQLRTIRIELLCNPWRFIQFHMNSRQNNSPFFFQLGSNVFNIQNGVHITLFAPCGRSSLDLSGRHIIFRFYRKQSD